MLRFRKDPIDRIRGNVLKALYTLGYKEIEEDLLDMLKNSDNFIKSFGLVFLAEAEIATAEARRPFGLLSAIGGDEMV